MIAYPGHERYRSNLISHGVLEYFLVDITTKIEDDLTNLISLLEQVLVPLLHEFKVIRIGKIVAGSVPH